VPRSESYEFHPRAWEECLAADEWYLKRSTHESIGFIDEVSAAIESIRKSPLRWPKHLHGTRRLVLSRFPFSVVYLDEHKSLTIIAVAQSKRKPGYWKTRL
jgi:plasmid stabilization system protein ParE